MFNWRPLRDMRYEKGDNRHWRIDLTRDVLERPEIREDGRRVTQNNLLALAWVLGYTLIDEHVHHEALHFFPPKNPNDTLDDWIEDSNRQYKRVGSLLLPRGVYKTTINITNCVQLIICWPLTIAIMVMCGRSDLAEDCVAQVGSFFYKPRQAQATLFQALWPELCVDRRPDAEAGFTTALRQTEPAIIEPAIWGESIESGTSGYHPNILIADDIHNNRNSRTFEARTNIVKKYKLAKKVLLPVGSEIRLGTVYGSGDLATDEVLTTRPGTLRRFLRPAMRLRNGERLDQNGFPEEDDIELLFPTILSYDFLKAEYESDFATFASQYLLDEYGAHEVVFSQEQVLAAMVEEAALPLEGETVIHWRFPCQKRNWHSAAYAVGQLYRNRCYITDAAEGHYKPSILAKLVVTTARKHHLHKVSIEDSPGARLMTSAISNYALTTGWDTRLEWISSDDEHQENTGERDLRIRNIEAVLSGARLFFYAGIKQLKTLMREMTQYGMTPDNALPDVIARVADHLPQSIAAEGLEDEDLAWEAMKERDHFNLVYGRGPYAPPEPEPEEAPPEEPALEDQPLAENGLENWMPGLNG
jgi:hypothetical protein